MEEIYTLLQERIDNVEEVKKKSPKPENATSMSGLDVEVNTFESSDMIQHLSQVKRMEKLRIIKENELMEVIFSLRSFDLKQKL